MRGSLRQRIERTAGALLLVMLAATAAAASARIERIRSAAGSDYTRVVIDLSRKVPFGFATLAGNASRGLPPRLYVDLRGVRLGRGGDLGRSVRDARVGGVRVAQHDASTTRVVFDLKTHVHAKVFALDTPPRIVVDLTALASAPAAPSTRTAGVAPKAKPPSASARIRTVAKKIPAPPPAKVRRLRVVIDPGHGGKDPGARGVSKLTEKKTAFDISKRLSSKLRRRLDVDVYMTRNDDSYIPLERRKDVANRLEADLFVSIHINASKNRKLHGIETYYLKNTNDRATLRLAKLENGVDLLIKGSDVSSDADLPYILSDMVQGQKEADSILLAGHVQTGLLEYLQPQYHTVESLGVKQGPFFVLDGTYMPAILVEAGFITNSLEGSRLSASSYREAIAEGLYRGIARYLSADRVGQRR